MGPLWEIFLCFGIRELFDKKLLDHLPKSEELFGYSLEIRAYEQYLLLLLLHLLSVLISLLLALHTTIIIIICIILIIITIIIIILLPHRVENLCVFLLDKEL